MSLFLIVNSTRHSLYISSTHLRADERERVSHFVIDRLALRPKYHIALKNDMGDRIKLTVFYS